MRLARSLVSLLPLAVGALALAITAGLWRHEQRTAQRALKADFDFSVRQAASRIEQRIASYEQMLRGVQGLFHAAGKVEAEPFERYVDTLLAGADAAGIQFFAFAAAAPQADGSAVSARVTLVGPKVGQNRRLLGDEPGADALRRGAMQVAADSSGLGITPRLALLIPREPGTQPGFLMLLPVYAPGRPVGNVAARRAALAGWVLAGIRMNDMMSSLYGEGVPGIEVRVYDGVSVDGAALMYASHPEAALPHPTLLDSLEYVGLAGHTWTLAISATPEFALRSGGDSARIIAVAGIGFSALLALLMHLLVGARQRAREAARVMTRELRASEERYRRIVETADEGIWMTDAQGRTSFVNPKLVQMLGHPREAILGRPLSDFVDPAQPSGGGLGELRLRRGDGTLLWTSMATTTIVDADGQPAGTLAMVTDIGERKQADAVRLQLEAQLRESQKMEAIGTLAGGIAHDFNNILAAILGNVALARDRSASGPAVQAALAQIGKAAERARSLVQQILAFSRKQPHHLTEQPLRPLIEESVRLLRPLLPALAELELRLDATPMIVRADATQLQQVLMNLCTNGWHALHGGAGRITIGLEAVALDAQAAAGLGLAAGPHAQLWVGDTGCGMDEATRARIFEPFFTTKPVGQGTGLGLSVVHGIIATHGGAITVASRPGQGSRFDVFLPLRPARDIRPAVVPAAAAAPVAAGRHAVYIDDDPVMVELVRALLQRAGLRVTCFDDPGRALATLLARPADFDIVVTDYNMPGLSGLDVAAALGRVRADCPIVISSGYISGELVAAARQAGVLRVMAKEYTLEQLPGIVGELLAGRGSATA